MHRLSVYLAGGFRSGWQDETRSKLPGCIVYDPSSHKLAAPSDYVRWDLDAIKKSDVVLAYMERKNPGGYALALEVGYAKALNKIIYLVEEHPSDARHQYFNMVREVADRTFQSIGEAIAHLDELDPKSIKQEPRV